MVGTGGSGQMWTLIMLIGALAAATQIAGLLLYIRGLRRGAGRPGALSWVLWADAAGISLLVGLRDGASAGTLLLPAAAAFGAFCLVARGLVPGRGGGWLLLVNLALLGWVVMAGSIPPGPGLASATASGGGPSAALAAVIATAALGGAWPVLRGLALNVAPEQPLVWFLWSGAHGLGALAVMGANLGWTALIYPALGQAICLVIGILALSQPESLAHRQKN